MQKISKNTIYFRLPGPIFFNKYKHKEEFLKKNTRGHGIVLTSCLNLLVAIPLRSSLNPKMKEKAHIYPYKVFTKNGKQYLKGLDFSKLLIISKSDLQGSSGYVFQDNDEKKFYIENFNNIITRLNNYITGYINMCARIENNQDVSRTQLKLYRYSTIRNFHSDLKINISKNDVVKLLRQYHLYK